VIAWVPAGWLWGALATVTLLALLAIELYRRLRRPTGLKRIALQMLSELERDTSSSSKESLQRALRSARRIVEHATGVAISGQSASELKNRAQATSCEDQRIALTAIADLELYLYAPSCSESEDKIRSANQELIAALRRLLDKGGLR